MSQGRSIKTIISPGGVLPGNVLYEQILLGDNIQYAIKSPTNDEVTVEPMLQVGEHILYVPLSPSPWLLPSTPLPYESEDALWHEIRNFVWEHIDFELEVLYDIYVAWVLCTWIPERWESAPYLHFNGPSNSGKTRALDILNQLCYRPLLSPSVSAASIYRALDQFHPTFLLDEFEMYEKMREIKAEVIGVLNAGYKRGQIVLRTDKVIDGTPLLRGFSVFGPKAISSILELPQTLHGRTVLFSMSRAVREVKRIINKEKALELRSKLLMFRFNHAFDEPLQGNPINLPDGRLIELYAPLVACAPSNLEKSILNYAMQQYRQDIETERFTEDSMVYNAIINFLLENPCLSILQSEIRDKVNQDISNEKEWLSKQKIGYILRRLGLKSMSKMVDDKRLMAISIDVDVLERRKQRYTLPEEWEKIDALLKNLRNLQYLKGDTDQSTLPRDNVDTADTTVKNRTYSSDKPFNPNLYGASK